MLSPLLLKHLTPLAVELALEAITYSTEKIYGFVTVSLLSEYKKIILRINLNVSAGEKNYF